MDQTSLTIQQLKAAAPKGIRSSITPDLTKEINSILQDPDIRDEYRENVLSYVDVLKAGKWGFGAYISAVKYISYKLRGDTHSEAYSKTFPDRVQRFLDRGVTDYSSWVCSYNGSKLVNEIRNRTLIPVYVLNADIHQKAINVQAQLMNTANSEKVRCDAANSLLTHLKPPETSKVEIDMNIKQDSGIEDLRAATIELAKAQRMAIEVGAQTAKGTAHSKIVIEAEVIEDE